MANNYRVYLPPNFPVFNMIRIFAVFLLSILLSTQSTHAGWQERADSLKALLQQSASDTAKIELYLELGKEVISNTPEASLEYYKNAQSLAEGINDTNYIVRSILGVCRFYTLVSEYGTSLELAYEAMEMSKDNKILLALCHNRLAGIHHMIEEYDASIKHNRIALALDIANGDTARIATDYHNIGTLFLETDDYDSALLYIHAANQLSIKSKGKPDSYSLSHIGLTYTYMEVYDSALHYHFEALNYDSIDERKYEMAIDYYYIAFTYFNIGNYTKTISYANQSIKIANELRLFEDLMLNYKLLYQVSEKQGKYKNAFEYSLLRNNYADSLRDKGKVSLAQSLNAKYKFEENEKQLARIEEKNNLLERQKTLLIILSFVTILLLVSTVIIINQINRRQKATRELLLELEKANKSKERLISIISHDLRGSIGTLRNAVGLIIDDSLDYETIKDLMKSFFPVVDSTYDLLENLLTWARYGKETLDPMFEHVEIKSIVEKSILHTSHLAISKNISVINHVEETIVLADRNMLLTVVRNLISNAIKFSQPKSQVVISCATSSSIAEIKVKDFGVGMKENVLNNIFTTPVDYHSKGTMGERGSGLGLSICKNFIEKLDGNIWAESKSGEGSSFYFTIPVVQKN